MSSLIHPSAIVDPRAQLDPTVEVGAFSMIGPEVKIGARTKVGPHVVIEGDTTIGQDNTIFQFNSIGAAPQDKKYGGEPTRLEIGDRNLIREFCTFNRGTTQDRGVTRLGNDNWMLAYVHVAHDCAVGDHCIFSNGVQLAGHVKVGDHVVMGGMSGVHQFTQIGSHAMVGMNTSLTQDVPPFVLLKGNPAATYGINIEGLKRRGFTREQINAIRNAYKLIYKSGLSLDEARAALGEEIAKGGEAEQHLRAMLDAIEQSTRGILR
jgi:UDP-N-acetylglucosamine acyltransferase